jgi:hypothetical protein
MHSDVIIRHGLRYTVSREKLLGQPADGG